MRSACSLLAFALMLSASGAAPLSLLEQPLHLGVKDKPEWDIFMGKTPASESLRLEFQAAPNTAEQTLLIRQSDVKHDWAVELNGRRLGSLFLMEADLVHLLPVPPGALREGTNELRIFPRVQEDIVIHEIQLFSQGKDDLLPARLRFRIKDESGAPLPARITVLDSQGFLTPLRSASSPLAVRPGVIYTGINEAEVGVQPGDYTVYITRGPEYALARIEVSLGANDTSGTELELPREVPTHGWIAADTHMHTLTLSRHGDATLRERMLTLAGEGVELAICTEHNLHADYAPAAAALGLSRFFTSVPGNEVTTPKGHFNIFPVSTNARPPDWKLRHWPDLMDAIRETPGVRVVVLNHPHDIHGGFTPFSTTNLHPVTGRNFRGFDFSFDAMELINSGAMRSDWMEPVRSWFALLNRGHRITGIGASDSHDVSRFIVGQGRTCIRAPDTAPGEIDVDEACASLLAGRAIVSLGLFPELKVNGKGPGEMVSAKGGLTAEARVLGPSWMRVDRVALFANGIEIREAQIKPHDRTPEKARVKWELPDRARDYHLVLIASGPGVTNHFWGLARPYQPGSIEWTPALIGITNPIWVDADGDGRFTSAREYAAGLVQARQALPALFEALAGHEPIVSAHAAEFLEDQGIDLRGPALAGLLAASADPVRRGFELYLHGLPD